MNIAMRNVRETDTLLEVKTNIIEYKTNQIEPIYKYKYTMVVFYESFSVEFHFNTEEEARYFAKQPIKPKPMLYQCLNEP
jgi:hypothetical protein